jgi:hypothetical protein
MKRVYQQITLVYDMRDEEMDETVEKGWIALVAESAQKKLKSISGMLLHRVIEVRIGTYEVEETQK